MFYVSRTKNANTCSEYFGPEGVYYCGIPIAWKIKGMRSVELSTTEVEYIALSEVVKEIKFIIQLMSTMNMHVELPIIIYVDNVGAIWLSSNRTTSERRKHVHI